MIQLLISLVPLIANLFGYYISKEKTKAELEAAYQNYALAKSKLFSKSADERESFEDQENRMNEIENPKPKE